MQKNLLPYLNANWRTTMTIIAYTENNSIIDFKLTLSDQECMDFCDLHTIPYYHAIDTTDSFKSDGKDQKTYDLYVKSEQNLADYINKDEDLDYAECLRYN